jgi:hypothetical protein
MHLVLRHAGKSQRQRQDGAANDRYGHKGNGGHQAVQVTRPVAGEIADIPAADDHGDKADREHDPQPDDDAAHDAREAQRLAEVFRRRLRRDQNLRMAHRRISERFAQRSI